ncbi:hypothetical protein GMAR_ORF5 [Golden Marseillevirus]|uniref:hypothetical protein n=1 Tax=Golden Marseillevirus TaxID=1720526 RepID=UPI000877AAA9|nr:hypothetical protein GMAR_ORF5 [Golden Marseillevirus]ALX27380.1 hypothetical protein GMAR_ORF5 [Golden Marseillevirus]
MHEFESDVYDKVCTPLFFAIEEITSTRFLLFETKTMFSSLSSSPNKEFWSSSFVSKTKHVLFPLCGFHMFSSLQTFLPRAETKEEIIIFHKGIQENNLFCVFDIILQRVVAIGGVLHKFAKMVQCIQCLIQLTTMSNEPQTR